MANESRGGFVFCFAAVVLSCVVVQLGVATVESDIQCLKTLHQELNDPIGSLSSWDFNNNTEGFICNFDGVECWHPDENRVLKIRLSGMGLQGQFPSGIQNCTSLTTLDFSRNSLSGPIPANIDRLTPYLVKLDLSFNNFSGELPPALGNLIYLNALKLDNNQFTGRIPQELDLLKRLTQFSVANNSLSGSVPFLVSNKSQSASTSLHHKGFRGMPMHSWWIIIFIFIRFVCKLC